MEYFRFEVRLLDAAPAPWRQFLIAKKATFENLHLAIQGACDWENCHLFAFHAKQGGPVLAGVPDDDYDRPPPDAARVKLSSFFVRGGPERCLYWYDFGDDWWHEVRLLDVARLQERFLRRLLAGERAFPPEDCGGVPGYEHCVAVALDQPCDEIEDPEELRRWMGDWHPERFNLAAVKREFDC